ncbi:MAG: hypothetical protein E6845_05930 [Clostridium sp.]|jgi:signal recognition particle subunit SEC65|uniref:hypothetical protein n=1 Tax=Clostridium TaxID=1485 RepID=UPI0012B09329|nr:MULTISPECIES: hypothetical protein [Clostridium]MDU1602485.1 hypothetical protein [Clostridium sp.]MSA63380.1 hypothetical protein [Gordonibacter pamelaeae]MZI79416.1 hypothetical protein [Clostridium butyricum]
MSDNWIALAAAILSPREIHIAEALRRLEIKVPQSKNNVVIDDKQFDRIQELRDKNVPWNNIAKQLGYKVTGQVVRDKFYRILAKKRTAKTPTKVV